MTLFKKGTPFVRSWSISLMAFAFLTVSAGASTFTTARITNDSIVDVEPTVVRQTASGVTATIMGYISYPSGPTGAPRNTYVSRGDDGLTFSGMLSIPETKLWTYSADPYLAPNQTEKAVHPERTYMVGTLGSLNWNGGAPTGIAVWTSDDAGRNWSAPTVIASTTPTSPNSTDKPHIGISQHSSSYGYVYVAYLQKYSMNGQTRYGIRVARSTDGDNWYGAAFGEDVEIYSSTNQMNCAQVVVAPANGYVYVTWVDFGTNRIMLARSPAPAVISGSWTIDNTGPTGDFYAPGAILNGGVRAITVPVTRYNWKTNKIIVVWHERGAEGSADVYVAAKGTTGWQAKQKISNEALCPMGSTADQWRPAVDFRSNGELYITYYDRQGDCANDSLYDLYFVRLGNGNPFSVLEGPSRVSTFQSNPFNNNRILGEYHELWCDAFICYSAWIGADTQGDLFLTTIQ
ncbi:MAG TPA: hypothetical protein VJZ76_22600 [Thermoanaerobaculia bacterium]|nr:hypothetical protein [Thermoanaerobaculia bacterium]